MATVAATPQITYCPPGAASNAKLDEYSHLASHKQANYVVRTSYRGCDTWESTGFSWEDAGMVASVEKHKLNSSRRQSAPEWAYNITSLRKLIVRAVELRAGIILPRLGTDSDRLQFAQQRLQADRPKMEALLDRFCREFVDQKRKPFPDAARIATLREQVAAHDQRIRMEQSCAGKILRIVQLYYGAGQDSVTVAEALKIKPPHVRQILHGLHHTWARMQREPAPVNLEPLFNAAQARMHDPQRKHCKNGHPICLENALPSGLQLGKYWCRECNRAHNQRHSHPVYKPKRKPTHGDQNSPDAQHRRARLAQGLCGKRGCKRPRWEGRPECHEHTLYYRERAREWQRKRRVTAASQIKDTGALA